MARPRNANAEVTRGKVLEAACILFSEHGVRETSVREVARHAGVSLAMIHHYFGSKNGLYEQCLRSSYTTLSEGIAELTVTLDQVGGELESASTEQRSRILGRVVREGFGLACRNVHAVRLLMRTLVEPRPSDLRWRDGVVLPFIEGTAAFLAPMLGRDATALRLPLQSLLALVMRYTVASPDELAALAGTAPPESTAHGDERAQALQRVEDHLVEVSQLLLISPQPATHGGIENER